MNVIVVEDKVGSIQNPLAEGDQQRLPSLLPNVSKVLVQVLINISDAKVQKVPHATRLPSQLFSITTTTRQNNDRGAKRNTFKQRTDYIIVVTWDTGIVVPLELQQEQFRYAFHIQPRLACYTLNRLLFGTLLVFRMVEYL
jgi:hypothetical protein